MLRVAEREPITYGAAGAPDLIALLKPPAWHADAACKEHPELSWFPPHGEDVSNAKAVCEGCLVRDECLIAGLEEDHGVWAGLSSRPRRQLLYLEGAGWDHVKPTKFPWSVTGYLAGLFQFDQTDYGTVHSVHVSVQDQDGRNLGASGVFLVEAKARLQTFAVQFNIVLDKVGWFDVKLSDDDGSVLVDAMRCCAGGRGRSVTFR